MMGVIGDDGYDRYDGFGHLPHRLEQGTPNFRTHKAPRELKFVMYVN